MNLLSTAVPRRSGSIAKQMRMHMDLVSKAYLIIVVATAAIAATVIIAVVIVIIVVIVVVASSSLGCEIVTTHRPNLITTRTPYSNRLFRGR